MATLQFRLVPDDHGALLRWPGVATGRAAPIRVVWHDTPERALAAAGLAVCAVTGPAWRLTRLRPGQAATPVAPLSEARRLDALSGLPPELGALAPIGALFGRRRALRWAEGADAADLQVLDGCYQGPGTPRCTWVTLEGEGPSITALADALATGLRLMVPRAGLPEAAIAAGDGQPPTIRALGAPRVMAGDDVGTSLVAIAGHLLDVMLHWADQVALARTPEPVHQMRVATRRLRSALSIYRRPAPCPELAGLAALLKLCAARLGGARDWDVFLGQTGAHLAEAYPEDRRCRSLLRAGTKRRSEAYAELRQFLESADFRRLTVALAAAVTLQPWEVPGSPALRQDVHAFAAATLERRYRRVRKAARDVGTMPIPALHELRKDCKRLRYAAEFFATLFPGKRTRRWLDRLSDLQEELGLLNDGAAVAGLLAQLGRHERGWAAGLVEGFTAAQSGPARGRIVQSWRRFRQAERFWS